MTSSPLLPGAAHLPPVFLCPPDLHYVPAHDGEAAANTGPEIGEWSRGGDGAWTCGDPYATVRVALRGVPEPSDGIWLEASVTSRRSLHLWRCAVELAFEAPERPWCLDGLLRWSPLQAPATTSELTPSVVRWRAEGSAWELRAADGGVACAFTWEQRVMRVRIVLDAAALHPRWSLAGGRRRSLAAPRWEAGRSSSQRLLLRRVSGPASARPAVAGRFPAGAEAAFTITGHCDFDETEVFRTFLEGDGRSPGWLGRGLRCTKGVFTLPSRPPGRPPAASLADPLYERLAHRLHDDGSEIAPHALNESGQLTVPEFRAALARIVQEFAPRTWIDHGLLLEYCYYFNGGESHGLLEELRQHGFTTLWAYHDAPFDASTSLNLLSPVSNDIGPVVRHVARHLWELEPLVATHYMRTVLRSHTEGVIGEAIAGTLSATRGLYMGLHRGNGVGPSVRKTVTELAKVVRRLRAGAAEETNDPFTRRELVAMAPSIYLERAAPFSQASPDELLLFASLEVLHVRDAYTGAALDRLLDERGMHIGHAYLMNRLPYIAGVFQGTGRECRLAPEWSSFLDALTAAVRDHRIWNPVVSELAEWARAMQLVRITPVSEASVEIHNPLPRPIADLTLLLPHDAAPASVEWMDGPPAGHRHWHDCLAVWGSVPANCRVGVRWRAGGEQEAVSRQRSSVHVLPLSGARPAERTRPA